jgi:hypothetical protein
MKSHLPVMAFLLTGIAGSFVADRAYAERYVIVNGYVLNSAQIQRLEQQACVAIPDGKYWLRNDGWWGHANDPTPRGKLGDYCRKPSLSERGLLFRPGEILSE